TGGPRRALSLLVGGSALLWGALAALPPLADAAEPTRGQEQTRAPAAKKPQKPVAAAKSTRRQKQAQASATGKPQKAVPGRSTAAARKGATGEVSKPDTKPVRPRRARPKALVPTVTGAALPFATPGLGAAGAPPVPNHTAEFEQGPGVLGVSLSSLRRDQLKEFPSEQVGRIAFILDDLRFTPINKQTHVEVNLLNRIPFEGKGDQLGTKARRALDGLGRLLVDHPLTRVQVLVHTNDQGDAGHNLRLSQGAAEAAKAYLVTRGVAAERLVAVGRGEEAPLVGTGKNPSTAAERLRNQRVELMIEPLPETPGAPVVQSTGAPITPPSGQPQAAIPTVLPQGVPVTAPLPGATPAPTAAPAPLTPPEPPANR
ncbi:MAG TPA: OmpA family protein, partial [Lamprocystis sp. (in: g-proteobacteria)]|nr:OmpA family protein [Lamprocystis sp. (in: g-proteobacteria)]